MYEIQERQYRQIAYHSQQSATFFSDSTIMPELVIHPKQSLQKMKMIQMKDLIIDKIMKDCYLCVQICLPSCKGPSLYIVFEDLNGDVIEASVRNLPDNMTFQEGQQYLPLNQWMAIKNPYLKVFRTGQKGIRIEDSQDVVLLSNHSVSLLKNRKPDDCTPMQFKEIGNNYFKAQQYSLAYESYTLALKTDDPSLREICLNNRSLCLIHLGWYDEAISDLKEVLTLNPLNEKANMRMGNALMELQQPILAMEYFKKIENWKLNHELIQKVVNCEMMKKYQNGDFNIYKLFKEYVLNGKVINVFPYKGPIERKESKIGGLGLFATRDIKRGEVVIIEKALLFLDFHNIAKSLILEQNGQLIDLKNAKFVRELKWKAINDKNIARKVFELSDGSNCYDINMQEKEFEYSLEQVYANAERISKIINLNSHAIQQTSQQEALQDSALWHKLSQINHSAFPNCYYYYLGDVQILMSSKHIRKGEELFVSYCDPSIKERYVETLQSHNIPIEKEIENQFKNWNGDKRFQIFRELEHNPHNFQLLSNVNKQLENQLKKEYPSKYQLIYTLISTAYLKKGNFQQFLEIQKQILKSGSEVLFSGGTIYGIAQLIKIVINSGQLNEKANFIFTELSSILFGPKFEVNDEVKHLLIKYAQKILQE